MVVNAAVGFILWYTFGREAQGIQPLVPALQSYWMKIHVPANFIGYGSFSLSAMVACAYLLAARGVLANRLPPLEVLDDLMYKSIAIGFAFFTIATILGAMWGSGSLGRLLVLGPQGNLGADRMAQLCRMAALASGERFARQHAGVGGH